MTVTRAMCVRFYHTCNCLIKANYNSAIFNTVMSGSKHGQATHYSKFLVIGKSVNKSTYIKLLVTFVPYYLSSSTSYLNLRNMTHRRAMCKRA